MHSIQKWSEEADAELQDCFARTDWNMFQDSSDGIEEFTTSVTTSVINKCIKFLSVYVTKDLSRSKYTNTFPSGD